MWVMLQRGLKGKLVIKLVLQGDVYLGRRATCHVFWLLTWTSAEFTLLLDLHGCDAFIISINCGSVVV